MSSTISSSASFSLKIFTALIGSPTYVGAAKRTVFTSPPSCTSRQGAIRGLSTSQLREVAQQASPEVMALLGMKLDAVHVVVPYRAAVVGAVLGAREYVVRPHTVEEKGMQEIETGVGVELPEQARTGGRAHVVPAHVRHGQLSGRRPRSKFSDAPVDPAQARTAALAAPLREHPHAHAHAEQRPPPAQHQFLERRTHPGLVEPL